MNQTSIGYYRDYRNRRRLSYNTTKSHDFVACEDKWSEEAPKIIEKCLKFLFESEDGERQPLLNFVKCLEITDRDGIWTLSTNCVKIITTNCLKLESLNISGRRMIPIDAVVPLFDELNVSNLLRFRLTGITDDMPMWFFQRYQIENSEVLLSSIWEFFERCEKLESFTLRLFQYSQFLTETDVEFKFPASLREVDIDHFDLYPQAFELPEFRLDLFENCRENLEKLRICSWELDKNLMHFATSAEFANRERTCAY